MKNYKKPELTPEWLTATLKRNGFLPQGEMITIRSELRPVIGITADFVFIEVTNSKDISVELPRFFVLKQNKSEPIVSSELEGWFRELIEAEVRFYQSLARKIDSTALIQCYDAAFDNDSLEFHLLLADLSHTHYQTTWPFPPSGKECHLIVESLAKIHGAWWGKQKEIEEFTHKSAIENMEDGLLRAKENIPSFISFLGDRISNDRAKILELTPQAERAFRKRLEAGKLTLVHGDSHFWNFFLPKDSKTDTIRIFDWQGYGAGFGPTNIAQFLGLHVYSEMRERIQKSLLQRYYEILLSVGITDYSWEECWYDYRLSAIPQLWAPVGNWKQNIPVHIWWSKLESAFAIFEDLDCEEIIKTV